MPRLPVVGSDTGAWGTLLNEFLAVALEPTTGALKPPLATTKTAAATLTLAEAGYVYASATGGAFTLTLPGGVAAAGREYRIVNEGTANGVTVAAASGETISGAASFVLAPGDSLIVHSRGTIRWGAF